MIVGGNIRKGRISFETSTAEHARGLQGIYGGMTSYFNSYPFNDRVNIQTTTMGVNFIKPNGSDFIYEEVKDLIKKAVTFDKITFEKALEFQAFARSTLDAEHSHFWPNRTTPIVEIGIFSNWARIDFNIKRSRRFFIDLKRFYSKIYDTDAKVFTNFTNEVSIHSATKHSVYLNRLFFRAMTEILHFYKVMESSSKEPFVQEALTFSIKRCAHRDAELMYKAANEPDAVISDDEKTVRDVATTLHSLSTHGHLYELQDEYIHFMLNTLLKRDGVEELPEDSIIRNYFLPLCLAFEDEIKECGEKRLGITYDKHSRMERERFLITQAIEESEEKGENE